MKVKNIKRVLLTVLAMFLITAGFFTVKAFAAGSINLTVAQKFITASSAADGSFTYALKPLDPASPMPGDVSGTYTFTISGNSSADIGPISYSKEGVYKYEIFQVVEKERTGYTYDRRVCAVKVYVYNKSGTFPLVIVTNEKKEKLDSIEFTNRYANSAQPPTNGTQTPGQPPSNGTQTPGQPPSNGTQTPGQPPTGGTQTPGQPPSNGTQTPGQPPSNGTQTPGQPPSNGTQTLEQPPSNGTQTPEPPPSDGVQPPAVSPVPEGAPPQDIAPEQDSRTHDPSQIPPSEEIFTSQKKTIEDITSEGVPSIIIHDMEIPLSSGPHTGDVWALLNLILCITGMLLAVFAILRAVRQKKEEVVNKTVSDDADEDSAKNSGKDPAKNQKRNRTVWLITAIILGVAGVVVFVLTENMKLLMVLTDGWTIVNVMLFVTEIVCIIFSRKKAEKDSKQDGDAEQVLR